MRISVILSAISMLIASVILFLGWFADRLPEASIVSGCIVMIVATIWIIAKFLSAQKDKRKVAYAGRQYVKSKCLCKYRNKMSMVMLLMCKNGVLVTGETLESSIMPYESITVTQTGKFNIRMVCVEKSRKPTYDFTLSSLIEVKAVLQILKNNNAEFMPRFEH